MARKPVLGIGLCVLAATLSGCQTTSPPKQNPTPTTWNNTPQNKLQNKQMPGSGIMPATANAPQDIGRFPAASGGNPTPLPTPPQKSPGMQPVNATPVGFGSPAPGPGLGNPSSGGGPIIVPEAPRTNTSPQPAGPDLVIPPPPPTPPGYNNNVPGLN